MSALIKLPDWLLARKFSRYSVSCNQPDIAVFLVSNLPQLTFGWGNLITNVFQEADNHTIYLFNSQAVALGLIKITRLTEGNRCYIEIMTQLRDTYIRLLFTIIVFMGLGISDILGTIMSIFFFIISLETAILIIYLVKVSHKIIHILTTHLETQLHPYLLDK